MIAGYHRLCDGILSLCPELHSLPILHLILHLHCLQRYKLVSQPKYVDRLHQIYFDSVPLKTMSTANIIKGSCLCQEIQYEVTGAPQITLLCHCDDCRKVTGSVFMANSIYQKDVSSPIVSQKYSNH